MTKPYWLVIWGVTIALLFLLISPIFPEKSGVSDAYSNVHCYSSETTQSVHSEISQFTHFDCVAGDQGSHEQHYRADKPKGKAASYSDKLVTRVGELIESTTKDGAAFFALILSVVTVGLYLTAVRQIEDARKLTTIAHRPWLKLHVFPQATIIVRNDSDIAWVYINAEAENIGKTVAVNQGYAAKVIFPFADKDGDKEIEAAWNELSRINDDDGKSVIFPSDRSSQFKFKVEMPKHFLETGLTGFPYLIFTAVYKMAGGRDVYRTPIVFSVIVQRPLDITPDGNKEGRVTLQTAKYANVNPT